MLDRNNIYRASLKRQEARERRKRINWKAIFSTWGNMDQLKFLESKIKTWGSVISYGLKAALMVLGDVKSGCVVVSLRNKYLIFYPPRNFRLSSRCSGSQPEVTNGRGSHINFWSPKENKRWGKFYNLLQRAQHFWNHRRYYEIACLSIISRLDISLPVSYNYPPLSSSLLTLHFTLFPAINRWSRLPHKKML